ncbi:MAG: SRPBCC family protein [Bacillus sp. (in: Bacteria)]|nr:SRPBCC family protein [Bacillus sp. (in: firmicutes)]
MADLKEKQWINKPVEDVFNFLANPDNRVEIFVNVVKIESLSPDGVEIGARFKEVRQLSNRKVASELVLTDYDVNQTIGFMTESNGLKVNYIYQFKDVDGGTEVSFEGKVQTNSFRTKLMKPMLVKMVKKEDGDHLLVVKKLLEEEQGDGHREIQE